MIQIIYTSVASDRFTLRGLKVMLAAGRRRNEARGITGMIVFHEGCFLQILEGEEEVVDRLFEKISNDPRHHHVELLLRTEIKRRSFGDSYMGLCNTSSKDHEEFPGLIEFLQVSKPFEEDKIDRARATLLKFREGAWHRLAS